MSGDGLLVTGGYDGSTRLSSTEVLSGSTWQAGPPLKEPLIDHCQIYLQGKVYITGQVGCNTYIIYLTILFSGNKISHFGQDGIPNRLNKNQDEQTYLVVENQIYWVQLNVD